jgi:hypothetical protein
MLRRDLLVEANTVEGSVENGDLSFVIMAAAMLLALEIGSELSLDIDRCRGRG